MPHHDQPSPESYYALRRNGLPIILNWDVRAPFTSKESRRALDALTILTYIFVATPDASYAASFYECAGEGLPGTTIIFSGGSERVSATVKTFLEQSLLPQLRTIAGSDQVTHPAANDAVFQAILSFGFDYWWQLVSIVNLDALEEALRVVPPFYEHVLDTFGHISKLLRELYAACELAKNRGLLSEDFPRIPGLLVALTKLLDISVQSALRTRDVHIDPTCEEDSRLWSMLEGKAIVPLDRRGIVDDQGQLASSKDLSAMYDLINALL